MLRKVPPPNSTDSSPAVADFDDDGALDVSFAAGTGTSGETHPQNQGRAYALRVGPGRGAWTTFRGDIQRTGTAGDGGGPRPW
jgi:hypothetical protein